MEELFSDEEEEGEDDEDTDIMDIIVNGVRRHPWAPPPAAGFSELVSDEGEAVSYWYKMFDVHKTAAAQPPKHADVDAQLKHACLWQLIIHASPAVNGPGTLLACLQRRVRVGLLMRRAVL
jgi:hypothetical protein